VSIAARFDVKQLQNVVNLQLSMLQMLIVVFLSLEHPVENAGGMPDESINISDVSKYLACVEVHSFKEHFLS
jgi:hypothetical protein